MKKQTIDLLVHSRHRFGFALIELLFGFAIITIPVGIPFSSLAQSGFTKITTGPILSDAADSGGRTWVDFDNDGDLDLYVSNTDGANLLYRNDGNGVFTKITDGAVVNAGPGSYSASWADFDNDGRIDLFIGRRPGPGLLFRQQGRRHVYPKHPGDGFASLAQLGRTTTTTAFWTCSSPMTDNAFSGTTTARAVSPL